MRKTHFYQRSLYLTTMKELRSRVADVFTPMLFEKYFFTIFIYYYIYLRKIYRRGHLQYNKLWSEDVNDWSSKLANLFFSLTQDVYEHF